MADLQTAIRKVPALMIAAVMATTLFVCTTWLADTVSATTAAIAASAAVAAAIMRRRILMLWLVGVAAGSTAALTAVPEGPSRQGEGRWHATVRQADFSYGRLSAYVGVWGRERADGSVEPMPEAECYLVSSDIATPLEAGATIALDGFLEPVTAGSEPDGVADFDNYLSSHGVVARLYGKRATLTVTGRRSSLSAWAAAISGRMCDMVSHSGLSPAAVAMVQASALGRRNVVMPHVREAMQRTGTSHLLALSGLHVGFVAMMLWALTFAFRAAGPVRGLTVIAGVWIFVLVGGAGVSLIRAAVMVTVATLAVMAQRPASSLNAMALAAIVIMAVKPYGLFTPGCVMTFAATAGILLLAVPVNERLRRGLARRPLVRAASVTAVTTVAAIAATSMAAIYFFSYMPLWSLPVNMVLAPLVPVVIIGGLGVSVLAAAGVPCAAAAGCVDYCYRVMERVTTTVAGWSWSVIDGVTVGAEALVLTAATLVVVAVALRRNSRRVWALAVASCMLTGCVAATGPWMPAPEGEMCVSRCPVAPVVLVREGDRVTLITSPRADTVAVRSFVDDKYSEYVRRAGGGVTIATGDCAGRKWVRRGNSIIAAGTHVVIVDTAVMTVAAGRKVDYALVSGLMPRGDVTATVAAVGADSVIAGSDMGVERAMRVLGRCEAAGMSVRSLRRSAITVRW